MARAVMMPSPRLSFCETNLRLQCHQVCSTHTYTITHTHKQQVHCHQRSFSIPALSHLLALVRLQDIRVRSLVCNSTLASEASRRQARSGPIHSRMQMYPNQSASTMASVQLHLDDGRYAESVLAQVWPRPAITQPGVITASPGVA